MCFTLTVGSLFIIYQHENVKISTVHAELLLIKGDMLRKNADGDAFRQLSDLYATCCFTDPELSRTIIHGTLANWLVTLISSASDDVTILLQTYAAKVNAKPVRLGLDARHQNVLTDLDTRGEHCIQVVSSQYRYVCRVSKRQQIH